MENLENKILLDDICEQLNKRTSENAKKAYINQVIKIKPHVSYVARDVVAKQIIDAAHFSFPEGIDITNISEVRKVFSTKMTQRLRDILSDIFSFAKSTAENYQVILDKIEKSYDMERYDRIHKIFPHIKLEK